MSISFSSSVSGIQSALTMLSISAHNIANINTDGFKKQRASLIEDDNGGVTVRIVESTEPGLLYQNEDGKVVASSNTDISEEIAGQISAKHLFSANVAALKTSDEMEKSLIDIIA